MSKLYGAILKSICIVLYLLVPTISISGEKIPNQQMLSTMCDNRSPRINNNGAVVWWAVCNGKREIFLAENDAARTLTQGNIEGMNPSINSYGIVVYQDLKGQILRYENGQMNRVNEGAGNGSRPVINDSGAIVWHGSTTKEDQRERSSVAGIFLYDGRRMQKIESRVSYARGVNINHKGTIVFEGWVDKPDATGTIAPGYIGVFDIFILDDMKRLRQLTDTKPFNDNREPDINDSGSVVWAGQDGVWAGQAGGKTHDIFLYDGKNIKRLTNNNREDYSPRINNKGEIVWYGFDGNDYEIYLYDRKGVKKITNNDKDDITPDINDNGDVVWASQQNDGFHIFLMHRR